MSSFSQERHRQCLLPAALRELYAHREPARANYGISAHVERLEQIMEAFGVCEAVIVGHSLGGSEALLLAQRHPEEVRPLPQSCLNGR